MILTGPRPGQPAPLLPSIEDGSRRVGRVLLAAASGSTASERATEVAAAIAAEHGGELVIVHVQPPQEVRVARLGPTLVGCRWLDDPYSEPVLLQARRLAWANGCLARVGLIAGPPVDGIVMAARRLDAGLVVVGARATRLAGWLGAPTRTRLAHRGPVPVLTVSPDWRAGAAAGLSGTLG
jgi:nucleotide-binding universal stress UspA family protein